MSGEFFVEIVEEIALRAAVERKTRFVKQENDILPLPLDILVPGKEREEPYESART